MEPLTTSGDPWDWSAELHRGAGGADHQHVVANGLIVDVDANDRIGTQVAIERTWFRLMFRHSPDALAWVREQRDDYLAAPGADSSVRRRFGPVCAGFFAFGSATSGQKTSPRGSGT